MRGKDIKRYSYEWADKWVIGTFPALKLNIDEYLSLKNYLESFMPKIAQSGEKGCRKKTSNEWFETQDSIAYWNDFARQKIVYSEIVREPQFYLDNGDFKFGNFFAEATSFILTGEKINYLLGILNSKITGAIFKNFYAGGGLGESGYRYKKAFIEKLPIPKVDEKKETSFVSLVNEIIECKKENKPIKELEEKLDLMVFELYNLNETEIKSVLSLSLLIATLLISALQSQAKTLAYLILENFESEIKEAFRYEEGLKIPTIQYEGKIIYSETTQEANFAYDNRGYVLDKTAFFIVDKSNSQDVVLYFNAILTSKIMLWYIRQTTATLGSKGFNMGKQYIEKLPIPKINDKNQSIVNKIIDTVNSRIKQDTTFTALELDSQINQLVYKLYELSDEEIAFIHSL